MDERRDINNNIRATSKSFSKQLCLSEQQESSSNIELRTNKGRSQVEKLPAQRLSYNELRNNCSRSGQYQRRFSFNAGNQNKQTFLNQSHRVKSSDSVASDRLNLSELSDGGQPVEILVSNLDYNIASKEWRNILQTHFKATVEILDIMMENLSDDTLVAIIRVSNMNDARLAISQFHRKKIGYKRIQVQLYQSGPSLAVTQNQLRLKQEVKSLLNSVAGKQLPVTKFLELFELRFHRTIALSELFKLKDVCEIKEGSSGGRIVMLNTSIGSVEVSDLDVDPQVCGIHCREGTVEYMQALDACLLPCVLLSLKTFKHQVHKLLQQHNGLLPVASFPSCYKMEFGALSVVKDHPLVGGVYLEHLISAVSGVTLITAIHGSKTIAWEEMETANTTFGQEGLEQKQYKERMLQFSREVVDLLRLQPACRLLLSKFIPTYHHHFGRQCRVADYGYSKLVELLAAFPNTVEILGTGPVKILTLTHKIQIRRFTSDIIKILKFAPGKSCKASELPYYYHKLFQRSFVISDYGVCYLDDLLEELPEGTIEVSSWEGTPDLVLALPQRQQTVGERTRTSQFSIEVLELLRQSPRCRIPFARFIPSFHHFYGRQVRVSDFGFTKLIDLLEALPSVIRICEDIGEKYVCLTRKLHIKIFAEHTLALLEAATGQQLSMADFVTEYMRQQGSPFYASDFAVQSLQELITKIPKVATVRVDSSGTELIVLANRKEVLNAATLVLNVMLERKIDSISEEELQKAYGSCFNLLWLQDELKEVIQVLQDPMTNSRRVILQPIISFARDLRKLLRANQGRLASNNFDMAYEHFFGVKLNPLSYGYPSVSSLVAQVPYVCQLRGRGVRSTLLLCDDFISQLAYKVAFSTEPQFTDIDDQLEAQEAMLAQFPSAFAAGIDLSPCRLLPVTPLAINQSETGQPLYINPTTPLTSPLVSPNSSSAYHKLDQLTPVNTWTAASGVHSPTFSDFTPVKQMMRSLQMDMAFSDQADQMQKLINDLVNGSAESPPKKSDFNLRAN